MNILNYLIINIIYYQLYIYIYVFKDILNITSVYAFTKNITIKIIITLYVIQMLSLLNYKQ